MIRRNRQKLRLLLIILLFTAGGVMAAWGEAGSAGIDFACGAILLSLYLSETNAAAEGK